MSDPTVGGSPSAADASSRHRFDVAASQDIYRGRILALRADEVVMPGGQVARREVVEHFGAVAVAALDDAGRLVLIEQYRHPVGRRLWELPAGLLDVPGEQPLVAAARELVEEVGVAARDWAVLVDVASSPGFTDEVVRVFLARGLSEVDRPTPADDEESDLVIHRMPVDEALRRVFSGEIVNAEAVAGILATHAVLTGAATPRPPDVPFTDRPHRLAGRD